MLSPILRSAGQMTCLPPKTGIKPYKGSLGCTCELLPSCSSLDQLGNGDARNSGHTSSVKGPGSLRGVQGCCLAFGHKVSRAHRDIPVSTSDHRDVLVSTGDHRDVLVSTASQDQSSTITPNPSLTWAERRNPS